MENTLHQMIFPASARSGKSLGDPVSVKAVRDLSAEEVSKLPGRGNGAGTAPVSEIERLKVRHHEVARRMALGQSDTEISAGLGYSLSHLNILRRSPMFQSLLFSYMEQRDRKATDVSAQMRTVAGVGLDRLMEMVVKEEADPDFVLKTTMGLLDRTGHSPVHKSAQVRLGLTPEQIRAIRELENDREQFAVIDSSAVRSPPESAGPQMGDAHELERKLAAEADATEPRAEGGDPVREVGGEGAGEEVQFLGLRLLTGTLGQVSG